MDLIRESKGCIVDLYKINNLNVIYEVGLAHSQGKRVFFLRSDKIKEDEIPSDIHYYSDYYYKYKFILLPFSSRYLKRQVVHLYETNAPHFPLQ